MAYKNDSKFFKFWSEIDHFYRKLMAKLGLLIANHPLIIIMASIIISLLAIYPLILGFKDYKKFVWSRAGSIELFTPSDSWSKDQKTEMEKLFPDGGYFADRTVVSPSLFIVLVSARTSTNVLKPEMVAEYANLRRKLESITFLYNNTVYDYSTLCGGENLDVFSSKCQQDWFILLSNLHETLPQILPRLTYPYVRLLTSNNTKDFRTEFYIGPLFGGVKVGSKNEILSAKYVRMIFNLPSKIGLRSRRESKVLLEQFSIKFMQILDDYHSKNLSINYWSATKYVQDMRLISRRIVHCLPYLIILLLIFALISCWMKDPVISQPYLAFCGVISASLGIECGFSLLFIFRVQLIEIAFIVPFLVMSIGIDDTFVMLNVWRQTDRKSPVKSRLSRTFEEAGVSITITSLTDVASFLIGTSNVFPAVRIFCSFAACTLATMFAFQLTFFGACLYYMGRREEAGRHSLLFFKIRKNESCSKIDDQVPQPWLNIFFEKRFSNLILNFWAQMAAGLLYAIYLGGAVFCLIFYMDVGLQVSHLVPYRSVSHSYLNVYENFFTKCSTSAEIVLADPNIDYEDKIVRRRILSAAKAFEFTNFTYKIDFWLQEFEEFVTNLNVNLDDQDDGYSNPFYHFLNNVFLSTGRFKKYKEDMNFACCKREKGRINANSTKLGKNFISSSRFYVQLINMGYENRSTAMHMLKDMVENYSRILGDMFIYDVSFPLAEQHDNILSGAVLDIVVGVVCMLFSAVIFVPHLTTCLCIGFTVFSINIGVLGYMALFGIHLDIISLITILLCIGFSVDYSAHMAYHFHSLQDSRMTTRIQKSLSTVGGPIVQSSLSMLIGVLTLLGVEAYITDTFVITVTLVMVIGVFHSIVILPILLLLITNGRDSTVTRNELTVDSRRRFTVKSSSDRPYISPPILNGREIYQQTINR